MTKDNEVKYVSDAFVAKIRDDALNLLHEWDREALETALQEAFRESGAIGHVVTPYLLQVLAKIAVETCDRTVGCAPCK